MAAASKIPRHLCRVLALIWVCVLWLPVLQMAYHPVPESAALAENRAKAPPPQIWDGLQGIRAEFPRDFDRFFGDNFGFRDTLVRLHASLLYRFLRTSPTGNVVLGSDGWLFYNSPVDGQNLDDYCGLAAFSANDLKAIETNLTSLASYLRERGVLFALLVGPSKHTIYPEYLPDSIRALGGETQLDQVARMLSGHPEIVFVDPRRALLAAKSRAQVFFKTDTHWNGAGALVAYRELMKALALAGAGVTVPAEADHRLVIQSRAARDLGSMLGLMTPEMETDLTAERLSAPRDGVRYFTIPPADASPRPTVGCDRNAPDLPRLAMFRDSFTEQLRPLLCPEFSRSVFFWKFSVDAGTIDEERPSVVVIEVTERWLDKLVEEGRPQIRG